VIFWGRAAAIPIRLQRKKSDLKATKKRLGQSVGQRRQQQKGSDANDRRVSTAG